MDRDPTPYSVMTEGLNRDDWYPVQQPARPFLDGVVSFIRIMWPAILIAAALAVWSSHR